MMQGWIKLHRKIMEWEWWDDFNVLRLWIYILLMANHTARSWHGITVPAGTFITSLDKLAAGTKLTVNEVRTALDKLKACANITCRVTNKYQAVSVVNWAAYQSDAEKITGGDSDAPQADGKPLTATKNDKNDKNSINYQKIVNMYNETCVSFPRCLKLSDRRRAAIKARIKSGYGEADFKALFEKAQQSRFLKGGNAKNWRAGFDWLITDAGMAKVLEGNYDDPAGLSAPPKSQSMTQTVRSAQIYHSGTYDYAHIERIAAQRAASMAKGEKNDAV